MSIGQFNNVGFQNPAEVIANKVIIEGENEGWFIYNGTAALGNPPVDYGVSPGTTEDPFGNLLPASGGVVSANNTTGAFTALESGQISFQGPLQSYSAPFIAADAEEPGILGLDSGLATNTDEASFILINSALNGGSVQVFDPIDGNTYDTQRLTLVTLSPLTVDSTSPVTLFSFPVGEQAYEYELEIPMLGTGTGVPQIRFSSAAAVTSEFQGESVLDGGTAGGYTDFQTSLNTFSPVGPALVNADQYKLSANGIIEFSTGGILAIQMNASTSVATCTIPAGTRINLYPITGSSGSGSGGGSGSTGGRFGNLIFLVPSGDGTGAKDYANINNAWLAGYTPWLTPGQYYTDVSLLATPPESILGTHRSLCTINWLGSGDCLRSYSTSLSGVTAGKFAGFQINGSGHAAGASSGFHAGDQFQMDLDISVENFTGPGDINVWLDNQYTYTEQITGKIYARHGTNLVVFDNSTGTSLSANATGSFDRFTADIFIVSAGLGNGVIFQNGAFMFDHKLGIYGNMSYGAAQYACLTITGSGPAGFSQIAYGEIKIGVECDSGGPGAVAPYTIDFATIFDNVIFACNGIMDFGAGSATFANANNPTDTFQFDGPIYGDASLQSTHGTGQQPYNLGVITNGETLTTRYTSLTRVTPTGNVTGIILEPLVPTGSGLLPNGQFITIINDSNFTITFDIAGTSNVADGTADVIQANTAALFWWSVNTSLWYRS
jgi:hypothetical protein